MFVNIPFNSEVEQLLLEVGGVFHTGQCSRGDRVHPDGKHPARQHIGSRSIPPPGRQETTMKPIRPLIAIAALCCMNLSAIAQPTPSSPSPQPPPSDEPGWAKGRPKSETAMKMAPVPAFPIPTAPDKLPTSEVQAAARLQGRDLGLGHARCARVAPGCQGQHLRQLAVRRQQGVRGAREGRARGQGHHRQAAAGHRHRVPQGQPVRRHQHARSFATTTSRTSWTSPASPRC